MAATERGLVLMLLTVLGCSEGGLRIADAVLDEGGTATGESSFGEAGEPDEGQDSLDGGDGPLDGGDGPLDGGDGPLDGGDGPLDGGESDGGEGEVDPVLVAPSGSWRYMTGDSIDADWATPEFDDLAWSSGDAPLGHGMPVTTEVPSASDQPTAWFRAAFELADASTLAAITGLQLRLRRDDGAIAYLNGVEVLRSNMPPGMSGPQTRADAEASDLDEERYIRALPDVGLLRVGTNVLAVEIHDRATDPEDRVIDATLESVDPEAAPSELEFRVRTLSYDGKYGPRQVGAIWIEDGEGNFVRTLEVWGNTRREHLVAWRTASDENDVDAVTASTAKVHGTHVATWDLHDLEGQPVAPGIYRVRVEFTEVNSNDGADPGPQIEVAFELGGTPDHIEVPSNGDANAFTDLLLWAP